MKKINSFLILLTIISLYSIYWVKKNFHFNSFDQILYTINNSVETASKDIISDYIKGCLLTITIALLIIIFLKFLLHLIKNNETIIEIKIKKTKIRINLFENKVLYKSIPIIFFLLSMAIGIKNLYIMDYIKNMYTESNFFIKNYVIPHDIEITFSNKKNLIYIYLESMETTYADKKNGGNYKINYIPELTTIAQSNISFSNNNQLGGPYITSGATWTMGGIIAQSSGVPYKAMLTNSLTDEYNETEKFFPGIKSLGDILEDNGYKNYLMIGSDAKFGGRDKFFSEHGNYTIYDYYTSIKDEIIPEDYYVFWGIEDEKLYEYAKIKLKEISKQKQPFNFQLLTVNTHNPDGYVSEQCEKNYDNEYLNSVACSSYEINKFLEWLKKQDFYKNTTIVLVGDHLSMNSYSFDGLDEYDRNLYNVFINSAVKTECETNRKYNSFDLYPTTLAALGADIEGNRLGLGTNLFSCDETLSEKYGVKKVNKELEKYSKYYLDCVYFEKCKKE